MMEIDSVIKGLHGIKREEETHLNVLDNSLKIVSISEKNDKEHGWMEKSFQNDIQRTKDKIEVLDAAIKIILLAKQY